MIMLTYTQLVGYVNGVPRNYRHGQGVPTPLVDILTSHGRNRCRSSLEVTAESSRWRSENCGVERNAAVTDLLRCIGGSPMVTRTRRSETTMRLS